MGGLFGGGGQTQPATYTANPSVSAGSYIPSAQPQVDQSLQQLIQQLGSQANTLGNAASFYQPGVQQAGYGTQLQQGQLGGNAYGLGSGALSSLAGLLSYLQPGALAGAQTAQGQAGELGAQLFGAGSNTANQIANQLQYYLPGVQAQGQEAQQTAIGLGGELIGGTNQLLNQAFDPQQALYQRLANQTGQQVAASNAMSGLSGTPYGANLANQAQTNLGINWNAQQQANEAAALGAANAAGTAGVNLQNQAGLLPAQDVSSLYGSFLPQISSAGQLGSTGLGLNAQSGQLPVQAMSSLYSSLLSPASSAFGLGSSGSGLSNQSALTPMQDLAALYSSASPAQTQLENALQSYLGLGQSAAQLAGNLGAQGFNQNQVGLGNMLGLAGLGSNALFGSSGLSGALGLGSSGLLGSAGGTALNTGTDFAGGAGSGLLGLLTGGKA